jgi:DNA-directed RNA polymerase subunit K/omega
VRQLNAGMRPYLKPNSPHEDKVDIALREIVEGKLTAEIGFFDPSGPATPVSL